MYLENSESIPDYQGESALRRSRLVIPAKAEIQKLSTAEAVHY
jgi:hypothetical protein